MEALTEELNDLSLTTPFEDEKLNDSKIWKLWCEIHSCKSFFYEPGTLSDRFGRGELDGTYRGKAFALIPGPHVHQISVVPKKGKRVTIDPDYVAQFTTCEAFFSSLYKEFGSSLEHDDTGYTQACRKIHALDPKLLKRLYMRQKMVSELKTEGDRLDHDMKFFSEARLPDTRAPTSADRYRDNTPYDFNRVMIDTYINASHVELSCKRYIISQAPREDTLPDFFRAIYATNTTLIVCLSDIFPYWNTIPIESEDSRDPNFITRTFYIKEKKITHLQVNWPDMAACPMDRFTKLLDLVDSFNREHVWVHCKAGLGRAGTFAIAHNGRSALRESKADLCNIRYDVLCGRMQRQGLVQTKEQLEMIYKTYMAESSTAKL